MSGRPAPPAPSQTQPGSPLVGAQFVGLAVLWGSSYLFMKVALGGLTPAQVAVGRIVLGATFLAVVMVITRRRWPRGARTWGAMAVVSVFLCVVPFLLYAWAGQHLPSSLSAIYNAFTPIAALVVSLAVLPDERLSRARAAGLAMGVLGVLTLAAPWQALERGTAGTVVLAQLACLAANACFGIAFVLNRRLLRSQRYDAITIAASQTGVAAVIGLGVAPLVGGLAQVTLTPAVAGSILALGALGTGLAYIWNNNVLAAWGATVGSTVTYLTPVVGVILGLIVLHEPLHWHEVAGGALILLGVLASQGHVARVRGIGRDRRAGGAGRHGSLRARPGSVPCAPPAAPGRTEIVRASTTESAMKNGD